MTIPPSPLLSEIRSPSSPSAQLLTLRALKNEIIGHQPKKESWIRLGIVGSLAHILASHRSSSKRRQRDSSGGGGGGSAELDGGRDGLSVEEETRLQAIIVVGSLAYGGPSFIPPLSAGGVLPPLLAHLDPSVCPPPIVLATLRSLNTIADSITLEPPYLGVRKESVLGALYTDQCLEYLAQIFDQTSRELIVQQQIALAAVLISKTCTDESRRKQTALSRVLDSLGAKVTTFMVASNFVMGVERLKEFGIEGYDPAPATARLAPILEAIATVCTDSRTRAKQLACCPAFEGLFPGVELLGETGTWVGRSWKKEPSHNYVNNMHSASYKGSAANATNFPPLGGLATWGKGEKKHWTTTAKGTGEGSALEQVKMELRGKAWRLDDEGPLATWLMTLIQVEDDLTRVMASWVLALLFRSGLFSKRTERELCLKLIPLLVRMLDLETRTGWINPDRPSYDLSLLPKPSSVIVEEAARVIALLVGDNEDLQQAALEAGVIKKLSQVLKRSYDPLTRYSRAPAWSPDPEAGSNLRQGSDELKLGEMGISPEVYHTLKMRQAVLTALAEMTTLKDEYRKALVDQGIVPFVVMSLIPEGKAAQAGADEGKDAAKMIERFGNPTSVLLAACYATRTLSRSVSVLRTCLVDAGLAIPLFNLLRHPDVEVKTAAAAASCNILLEFSPMRQAMVESGVLEILCDYAHSANGKLRVNALWALKHLVLSSPNPLKMRALQELGAGWLKQIICNGTEDQTQTASRAEGSHNSFSMGTSNAAGEKVDLLNSVDDRSHAFGADGDEDGVDNDEDDEMTMIDSIGALSRQSRSGLGADASGSQRLPPSAQQQQQQRKRFQVPKVTPIRWRYNIYMQTEQDAELAAQARRDDLALQEQGLDFLRNMITPPEGTRTTNAEMIDHVFRELGRDKLFEIFCTLLRPKTIPADTGSSSSSSNNHSHQQQQQQHHHHHHHHHHTRSASSSSLSISTPTQPQPGTKLIPPPTEILVAVLYVLVHIASGEPRHRSLLLSQTDLMRLIVPLFNHSHTQVRTSCAWITINLTWTEDQADRLASISRARELRDLGILRKVEELNEDPVLDVRERAKTALNQFTELLSGPSSSTRPQSIPHFFMAMHSNAAAMANNNDN